MVLFTYTVALLITCAFAETPAQALQRELQAAADAHAPVYTVAAGEYNFTSSLVLTGASDLAIVFSAAGVALWFVPATGVSLVDCERVQWNGPSVIDYDPPTYAQGTVTGLGPLSATPVVVRAAFDHRFPFPDPTREPVFRVPFNDSVKVGTLSHSLLFGICTSGITATQLVATLPAGCVLGTWRPHHAPRPRLSRGNQPVPRRHGAAAVRRHRQRDRGVRTQSEGQRRSPAVRGGAARRRRPRHRVPTRRCARLPPGELHAGEAVR
jgi:hypothetical protein